MSWSNEEFTKIFTGIYPGLCGFLETLVGRTGRGQELAQEAFLRLYQNAPSRLSADEARFWVYRVGRNLALNELRRTRTWRTISERFAAVLTRKKEDQDDRLHGTDDSPLLKRLLAQLPEHQRAALLLRELEEMSYQEIAKVLSVSESKVKVDIHRARIALRTNARKQFDSRSSTTVLAQQTRARRTRRSRE